MPEDSTDDAETPVEHVAYVPRSAIAEASWFETGFHADPAGEIYDLLRSNVRMGPRPQLEHDPSKQQLIPYVVLEERRGGRILTLRRRQAQSEQRLHDNWSIGVGGHISRDEEMSAERPIRAGMRRELHEELHAPEDLETSYRGLVNDDTNEVGSVHLGLVFHAETRPDEIAVREVEKMEGTWLTLERLEREEQRLETWSQLLLEPLRSGAI